MIIHFTSAIVKELITNSRGRRECAYGGNVIPLRQVHLRACIANYDLLS